MQERKNKPISKRLKSAKSYQVQQKILSDWAKNWQDDQSHVIDSLRSAVVRGNTNEVMHAINQLKGLTEKRFDALNNVLFTLSDPDRTLRDLREEEITVENTKEEAESAKVEQLVKSAARKMLDTNEMVNEIIKCYNANMPIKEIAEWNHINDHKVVKILVTYGNYSSETYDKIKMLREDGKTDDEIADILCINRKTMDDYTPYKKGLYGSANPSENALRIRASRAKK